MRFERAFGAVRRIGTDAVEQNGFCQYLTGILHQQLQDRVLRPGQLHLYITDADFMGCRVQRQAAAGVNRCKRGTGRLAQTHGHASQQFFCVEWLGEVIRRAAKKQIDLVLHGSLGADHNDRDPLNPGQNFLTAESRQHQVEQNEIGMARFQEQQRLRPGVSALHHIARPL